MTRNHIPKAPSLGPAARSILGYSGRGIVSGTTEGTAVSRVLPGLEPSTYLPVPMTNAQAEGFRGIKGATTELGAVLSHAVSNRC